jgi:hypothetical protein
MKKSLCSKIGLLLYRFGPAGGGVNVTRDSLFLASVAFPVVDTPYARISRKCLVG